MTKLNDTQLSEVSGGSTEITRIPDERTKKANDLPAGEIDYGNMIFADDPQFGVV